MTIHPITFGDEGQVATRELLRRFDTLEPAGPKPLRAQLATLEALDRQYGGSAPLELEDVEELVAAIVTGLAALPPPRPSPQGEGGHADSEREADFADLTIGVALWAIRHEVAITVVEPVVNALAIRSNEARSPQELAAVFGLMQGVIAHVRDRLAADLERSNPERPWRLLHANFAITAIRTGDPDMIDFAFDALEGALPDESANFYAEALALALAPRIPAAVRERIQARHAKWAPQ
jgi:hypothetical protein